MAPRLTSLALILSFVSEPALAVPLASALRPTGLEESGPTRRALLGALSAGAEERNVSVARSGDWKGFRSLLKQAAIGPGREAARDRLSRRFGEISSGFGGVEVRLPQIKKDRQSIHLHLFTLPPEGSGRKGRPVHFHLPNRFRGSTVRIVPWISPDGSLELKAFWPHQPRLIRQVRWSGSPRPGFHLTTPVRQERLQWIPLVPQPLSYPAIDPSLAYPRDRISRATLIPENDLEDLDRRGGLYRDSSGRIPGVLVDLLARTYRQIDREEYPLSALQDFLGKNLQQVTDHVLKSRIPVLRREGEPMRLSRREALRVVWESRFRSWVSQEVGGFVPMLEASRLLGVGYAEWVGWPGKASRVPYFAGVPLWVRFGRKRYVTRKGFEGLLMEEAAAVSRSERRGDAVLLNAVKQRYAAKGHLWRAGRYAAAFRAVQELGVPYRILDDPLRDLRSSMGVPRKELDRIFEEAETPTPWTAEQIREDRWYGVPAAARVLGVADASVGRWIRQGKLSSREMLGRHWVSGNSLLRLLEKRTSAGAEEELNLDERPMAGPDYDPGVEHAPVLGIQAQNPFGPQWGRDEFFGYDLAGKAAVVIRDVGRGKICAFLAYERHEPHDEDTVPEPREIEIRHLGIHQDYWGNRQVEEALIRPFLEESPRVPVVMRVHLLTYA